MKVNKSKQIPVDKLREMFVIVDKELRWKKCLSKAGSVCRNGYLLVTMKKILAHRIVWALHHGEWPTGNIDHVDGDKSNNDIKNLRDVSQRENKVNTLWHRSGGITGINFRRDNKKWAVFINAKHPVNNTGKRIYLGQKATKKQAISLLNNFLKGDIF